MARKPPTPARGDSQYIPVTDDQVDSAWRAYSALQRAASAEPALIQNDYFTALQDTAYARFLAAFEAL